MLQNEWWDDSPSPYKDGREIAVAQLLQVSSRGVITLRIECDVCSIPLENIRDVIFTDKNRPIHWWCK